MHDPSYLPGSWFAVVTERAVVLLESSVSPARLQAVWETCNGDPSLDQLIEVVTGGRFVGAPFFGIGIVDGAGLRVVVRTGVTAVVGESIGAARAIVSGNANTWVEETLDQSQSLRLFRDSAPSPVLALPVKGGIVMADEVTWTPSSVSAQLPIAAPPAVAEAPVPPAPSAPAVLASVPAAPVTPVPPLTPIRSSASLPSAVMVPLAEPIPPADQLPVVPAAPASDSDDSDWSVWQLNEAGELAGSGRGGDQESPEPVERLAPDSVDPALPWSDLPPPLPEDQPPSLLESRPDLADTSLAEASPAGSGLSVGSLHFSTGQIVPLDRAVIVGRAPSVDPVQRPDLPRTIKIDNLDQDISRNHVEVCLDGRLVFAVDLNSANGTLVTVPGQMPQRLIPLEPFMLVGGSIVTLSNQISFTYEAA
jgi:hypothetical protein